MKIANTQLAGEVSRFTGDYSMEGAGASMVFFGMLRPPEVEPNEAWCPTCINPVVPTGGAPFLVNLP